jgi:hypothetical protein
MHIRFHSSFDPPHFYALSVLLPSLLNWHLHSEENSEAELIGFLLAVAGLDDGA